MGRTVPNIDINSTQKLRDRVGFKDFVLQVATDTFIYSYNPTTIEVTNEIYFNTNLGVILTRFCFPNTVSKNFF